MIIDDNAEIVAFTDNMQSVKFIKNINATYSISNTLEVDNRDLVMTIARMNGIGARNSNSLSSIFQ